VLAVPGEEKGEVVILR